MNAELFLEKLARSCKWEVHIHKDKCIPKKFLEFSNNVPAKGYYFDGTLDEFALWSKTPRGTMSLIEMRRESPVLIQLQTGEVLDIWPDSDGIATE